jgi:hypothetical protein
MRRHFRIKPSMIKLKLATLTLLLAVYSMPLLKTVLKYVQI